jgi:hypothetical protein
MDDDIRFVRINDLLAEKMDGESNAETKKLYQKLINKINSCTSTPLNEKHALRMAPFAADATVYRAAVEIVHDHKDLGLHGYPPEFALAEYARSGQMYWTHTGTGFGSRLLDLKSYWYLMALLVCNLSDEAEQVIAEIIDGLVDKNDYFLMNRTLGFFASDGISRLRERLKTRDPMIMNR